jgi:hypothetical protein
VKTVVTTPVPIAPVTYLGIGVRGGFQIAGGGVESFNVYNGDTTNVLLVSQQQNPQLSSSLPIQPLTNATVIGNGPWYASAQSGTIASVTVSPGAQLSPSPGQVAVQTAIQLQGVLTSAPLYDVANITLTDLTGPGVQQPVNLIPITPVSLTGSGLTGCSIAFYSAYEVLAQCLAGATAIAGCVQVTLTFYNQVTDVLPLATVKWVIPSNNPAVSTLGNGPMRGNFMAVQVASLEPSTVANPTTLSKFSLTGSLRQAQNDNWQAGGVPFGTNNSSATPFTNQLLNTSPSVPNGGAITRGILLYAGKARLFCENTGATGILVGSIQENIAPLNLLWHGAIAQNPGGANPTLVDLILPREPLTFQVQNTGAAAAVVNAFITADRV